METRNDGEGSERDRERRIEAYVKAYRRRPETESELAEAEALARMSLARVDWDG